MARKRLSDLERAAFTQIDGAPAMNVEVVTGNETAVPEMRLSELQRNAFTMIDGKVSVRSTITGSGGFACEVTGSVQTQQIGFRNGTNVVGSTIPFNELNDGFQWTLEVGSAAITKICDNTLVDPLPISTSVMGALALTSITLSINGGAATDITSMVTSAIVNDRLVITDLRTLINPSVLIDGTFVLVANTTLGGTAVDPISTTLTYSRAQATVAITTPNLNFDSTYSSATITRTVNGPVNSNTTTFAGNTIDSSLTTINFTARNRLSDVASRTLRDIFSFRNPTRNINENIDLTVVLTPTFLFPIYLGSVAIVDTTNITTVNLNNTALFARVNATSTGNPLPATFTWVTGLSNSNPNKMFFIRRTGNNGRTLKFTDTRSGFSSTSMPFTTVSPLAIGDRVSATPSDTEQYDVYLAQAMVPGTTTLEVSVL